MLYNSYIKVVNAVTFLLVRKQLCAGELLIVLRYAYERAVAYNEQPYWVYYCDLIHPSAIVRGKKTEFLQTDCVI